MQSESFAWNIIKIRVGNRLHLLITLSWITYNIPILNFYRYAVIGSFPGQINEKVRVSSLKFESTLKIIIKSVLHFYHVPRWILSRARPIPNHTSAECKNRSNIRNSVIIMYLVDIIITHHYLSTSRLAPTVKASAFHFYYEEACGW